jgi:rhamnogalacturonyl hydrolase YesR
MKESKYIRLAWIQAFKRSPVNFRVIAGVPKGTNPKGLGLFLIGYCNLWRVYKKQEYFDMIRGLSDRLLAAISPGWSGACWGYDFDWQARVFFQPRGTPTIVASSFIAYALLDAYDILKEEKLFRVARSVADFISRDLKKTFYGLDEFAWSYSPLDQTSVYNATLLGARILARLYHNTGETWLKEEAMAATRFAVNRQNPDGSWYYSPLAHHQWIDNFHTGFNLECIAEFMKFTGEEEYRENMEKGFSFWLSNFFTSEGMPRYFSSNLYPVDLHATAELVIACSRSGKFAENKALIEKVLTWSIENMQSEKGYFHYQKTKYFTNRIPYMRWTQAWMFTALTEYLAQTHG